MMLGAVGLSLIRQLRKQTLTKQSFWRIAFFNCVNNLMDQWQQRQIGCFLIRGKYDLAIYKFIQVPSFSLPMTSSQFFHNTFKCQKIPIQRLLFVKYMQVCLKFSAKPRFCRFEREIVNKLKNGHLMPTLKIRLTGKHKSRNINWKQIMVE